MTTEWSEMLKNYSILLCNVIENDRIMVGNVKKMIAFWLIILKKMTALSWLY